LSLALNNQIFSKASNFLDRGNSRLFPFKIGYVNAHICPS
jgi:hypothetical protein